MSARLLTAAFRGINIQTYPASIYTLSTHNQQQQLVKVIIPKNLFEMPVVHYTDQSIAILDKKPNSK
ncbi:unnamed protein product [Paramecium primaurelia]|uniref:Uncharacterized protein n=2 Tax=Paramecium TaxID=5884 RepID=A0A8S1Y7V2_9CILI|nr:unnamed protein product [Paramecium primaurelia]CAD8209278.1 unnamed protein product [Paramecium pentaurelia]